MQQCDTGSKTKHGYTLYANSGLFKADIKSLRSKSCFYCYLTCSVKKSFKSVIWLGSYKLNGVDM
jgi:hypothetical protein